MNRTCCEETGGYIADTAMLERQSDGRILENSRIVHSNFEAGMTISSDGSDLAGRVFNLEHLVCDLLEQNERLRQRLRDLS
jgi:hypothetical protein